ncbi:MAG: hypothetical protein WCI57_00880 [Candidatus Berkelbacteria bacterium]
MSKRFIELSFEHRFEAIQQALGQMRSLLMTFASPISLMTYGSATYGYNDLVRGNMDDIDAFLIVPSDVPYNQFLSTVNGVVPKAGSTTELFFEKLISSEFDIIRFYGENDGIKLGFRVITEDLLVKVTSESTCTSKVINVAPKGAKQIFYDTEVRLGGGPAREVSLDRLPIGGTDSAVEAVRQYSFSDCREYLGIIGRKLLTCQAVYDPYHIIKQCLDNLWKAYVKFSYQLNPAIQPTDLINSIMRSERFSDQFRVSLQNKIEYCFLAI